MGFFSSTPARSNGVEIIYSWFNVLRTAGINVELLFGSDYIVETSATIANNQSSASNVTGLLFSSSTTHAALIEVFLRRKTNAIELISVGFLKVYYDVLDGDWKLIDELSGELDDETEFTITSGGQVQYTSSNIGGSGYVGTMRFKATTFGVIS